jgi:hypothetical protein
MTRKDQDRNKLQTEISLKKNVSSNEIKKKSQKYSSMMQTRSSHLVEQQQQQQQKCLWSVLPEFKMPMMDKSTQQLRKQVHFQALEQLTVAIRNGDLNRVRFVYGVLEGAEALRWRQGKNNCHKYLDNTNSREDLYKTTVEIRDYIDAMFLAFQYGHKDIFKFFGTLINVSNTPRVDVLMKELFKCICRIGDLNFCGELVTLFKNGYSKKIHYLQLLFREGFECACQYDHDNIVSFFMIVCSSSLEEFANICIAHKKWNFVNRVYNLLGHTDILKKMDKFLNLD